MYPCQPNLAIDTETGGRDPARDALLEIGAVMEGMPDGLTREWRARIMPAPGLRVDPRCWTVPWNNYRDPDQWRESGAMIERDALAQFAWWIHECYAVATGAWAGFEGAPMPWAHNASFDRGFLDQAFMRCGIAPDSVLDKHWGCTMSLSWGWRRRTGLTGSVSMKTMGILCGHWTDESESRLHHDALEDARACAALRRWLTSEERAA